MNTRIMINRLATGELLCNACYTELQDENLSRSGRNRWQHDSVPWHIDAVCVCCGEAHPDRNDVCEGGIVQACQTLQSATFPSPWESGIRMIPVQSAG